MCCFLTSVIAAVSLMFGATPQNEARKANVSDAPLTQSKSTFTAPCLAAIQTGQRKY